MGGFVNQVEINFWPDMVGPLPKQHVIATCDNSKKRTGETSNAEKKC
jgi:hypothetical protein